jgi:hypothetical protein
MNHTKQEIEAQIIAWLKMRTEIQRQVREITTALEAVELKLADLVNQLQEPNCRNNPNHEI